MSQVAFWLLWLAIPTVVVLIAYARGNANVPPPPQNAQWAPDPTGRHQLRLWDGRQWTANISNQGVSGWDPLP